MIAAHEPFVTKAPTLTPKRERWEVECVYLTGRATSRTVYADTREEAAQKVLEYMHKLVEITHVRHLG